MTKAKKKKKKKTVAPSAERYSPRLKAEFLLNNAIGVSDYERARKEVRRLGLEPDSIPHIPPEGHHERS
jgi:hypothetical protein